MAGIKKIAKALRRSIGGNAFFRWLEKRHLKNLSDDEHYPILFIVGAPRCGSTYLYQVLVSTYKFAFLTNVSAFFYKSPIFFSSLFKSSVLNKKKESFQSEYGYVKGLLSPSEAGAVFNNWFDDTSNYGNVKKSINKLSANFSAPFLSKNLNNTFRIEAIKSIFENAVFIHIKREKLYNIQSIYQGLEGGRINNSVIESLSAADEMDKAVKTYRLYEEAIAGGAEKHPGSFITIEYENFCENPQTELNRIEEKVLSFGTQLKKKENNVKPVDPKNKVKLSGEEWQRLNDMVKTIE